MNSSRLFFTELSPRGLGPTIVVSTHVNGLRRGRSLAELPFAIVLAGKKATCITEKISSTQSQ
jgi:hypothetical protein